MGFLKGLVELAATAALHKQSGENQLITPKICAKV